MSEYLKILRCVLDMHIGAVFLLTQFVDVNLCKVNRNSRTAKVGYTVYFLKLQGVGPGIARQLQHELLMKDCTISVGSHTWSQIGNK